MAKQGNIGVTSENIFPIIKKFLYSDHEIFLRELVSNAVDATQKLKTLASVGEFKGELGDLTVQEVLQEKVLTIGENIQIRRFERFDESTVNVAYNHMGGVIGVLVGLQVSDNLKDNATVKELGKDIGMQAAAMNPSFMDKSQVDEATLAKE